MRHIIPISGKGSLCTAIVQMELEPNLSYEFIFNELGVELPPVNTWLERVEGYLGKKIIRVGDNLLDVIEEKGILPSVQNLFCTHLTKIKPLEDYLRGSESTVYYGIRADEEFRSGYEKRGRSPITPKYPLKHLNLGLPEVWSIVGELDLLPPFFEWRSLIDLVKCKLGADFEEVVSLGAPENLIAHSASLCASMSLLAYLNTTQTYFGGLWS